MKLSLVLSSWRSSRLSFGEQALPSPLSASIPLVASRTDCSSFFPPRCSYSLDVSDWMINGDYIPTRLAAQHDAGTGQAFPPTTCRNTGSTTHLHLHLHLTTRSIPAGFVVRLKFRNRESTVGVLLHGGRRYQRRQHPAPHPQLSPLLRCPNHHYHRVTMLAPPTTDEGKIRAALAGIKCGGPADLLQGIKIAMVHQPCTPITCSLLTPEHTHTLRDSQLALKHRRNKHGGQRIVVFVGSPVTAKDVVLKKLGNQLRKNNVPTTLRGVPTHTHTRTHTQHSTLIHALSPPSRPRLRLMSSAWVRTSTTSPR